MATRRDRKSLERMTSGALLAAALVTPVAAQVTSRLSLARYGVEVAKDSGEYGYSITPDGRYVAFHSDAPLDPNDQNVFGGVFVLDRETGVMQRASVNTQGLETDGPTDSLGSISDDARYVAFESLAPDLVPGTADGWTDIFVRDRVAGTTEQLSLTPGGGLANNHSHSPAISADGRYVAFWSYASNLVAGDTNGFSDVFVRDIQNGTTELVSVDSTGAQGNGNCGGFSLDVSISSDGRFVAFQSVATNLVAGDTNGFSDVFVRDRLNHTTELVSVDSTGALGNGDSGLDGFAISRDGRYVAFGSAATNLVAGDTNGVVDAFIRDRQTGTTERVSVDGSGTQGDGASNAYSVTADGRYVGFSSMASNLVPGDTNAKLDAFVRDRQTGTTERVSVDSAGVQGNNSSNVPAMTPDGRFAIFSSRASNLVQRDMNGHYDVFLRDRAHPAFPSLCDPGVSGVAACPCFNPPSGPGRGCDNSASTGGASLSISGGEYLSSDSIVFTTSGERPVSLSIVMQGTTSPASGLIYGQGVRCAAGPLKRLYSKTASGGSITAPNFSAGDLMVHLRSLATGNQITAGSTRWYFVVYRDPVPLGGCPAYDTFNCTQTRAITWMP